MRPSRIPRIFIGALGIICVAYALGDRGIAYVGFGQVFMGEMVLALGVLAIVISLPRMKFGLLDALLVGFIALGAARTIPYIGQYGIDALRDGVSWGYALFADRRRRHVPRRVVPDPGPGLSRADPDHARVVPDRGRVPTSSPAP